MTNGDNHYHLRKSLVIVSENLLKLLTIDFLINFKKSIGALVFSGLILLFSFSIWALINCALAEYLSSHAINHLAIYGVLLILNSLGVALCYGLVRLQLGKIQFSYTARALERVKKILGETRENS
jgi:hypothetical protein